MMFWILIFLSVIGGVVTGAVTQSAIIGLLSIFVYELVLEAIFIGVSIIIGPGTPSLVSINEYKITKVDKEYFTYLTPNGFITKPIKRENVFIYSNLYWKQYGPHVVVRQYEYTGWRNHWLLNVCAPLTLYHLYIEKEP